MVKGITPACEEVGHVDLALFGQCIELALAAENIVYLGVALGGVKRRGPTMLLQERTKAMMFDYSSEVIMISVVLIQK